MQYIYRFEAMSTPCEVQLFSDSKAKADMVASKILKEAKRLELKYNYFNSSSFLSKINSRVEKGLDLETETLIKRAIKYWQKTDEVFDITVATIKDIYKSSKSLDELEQKQKELLAYIGCEHISIKKRKIYFDNPYTKIDLGGFVKEYAVDRAVLIAKKGGIKSALINFGGDIFALGKRVDGTKFKIGIKDPNQPTKIAKFAEIEDEALTTSASYERYEVIENKKFSHIIAKKRSSRYKSVTVISSSCVESGVYSTALMIDDNIKTSNKLIVFV